MTARPDSDDPAQPPAADHRWDLPILEALDIDANDAKPLPKIDRYKPSEHTAASLAIRKKLAELPGEKRIRKRHVGRYIATDSKGDPKRRRGPRGWEWVYVYVSKEGDEDIDLIWRPETFRLPLVIQIEVKTGTGKLHGAQRGKPKEANALGAYHVVVGNARDAWTHCWNILDYEIELRKLKGAP